LHGDEVGTLCIVGEFEARSSTESPIGDRSSRQKWIPLLATAGSGHGSANGLDKKDRIATYLLSLSQLVVPSSFTLHDL